VSVNSSDSSTERAGVSVTVSEETVTVAGAPGAAEINSKLAAFIAGQHPELDKQVACAAASSLPEGHGADLYINAWTGATSALVSVLFDSQLGSSCMAHPSTQVRRFLLDPTTGADIDWQNLFTADGLSTLALLLLTLPDVAPWRSPSSVGGLAQACSTAALGPITPDDIIAELGRHPEDPVGIGIVSDGLMVDFPRYSFDRGNPCSAILKVSLAQLGSILRPEYLPVPGPRPSSSGGQ
jgi:hypothetical protein